MADKADRTADQTADRTIYVAMATILTPIEGRDIMLVAGRTTVRAGHPLLDAHPALFTPMVPDYEVEQSDGETQDPADPGGAPAQQRRKPAAKPKAGSGAS